MLVMVAAGVVLAGVVGVMLLGGERRRGSRVRILQLATDIEEIALSIEADFVGSPEQPGLHQLASLSYVIARRARAALQRKGLLAFLPGRRLYAEERQLHHDHGEIVHLRSRVDCCLAGLSEHGARRTAQARRETA